MRWQGVPEQSGGAYSREDDWRDNRPPSGRRPGAPLDHVSICRSDTEISRDPTITIAGAGVLRAFEVEVRWLLWQIWKGWNVRWATKASSSASRSLGETKGRGREKEGDGRAWGVGNVPRREGGYMRCSALHRPLSFHRPSPPFPPPFPHPP
ncbi:hypothetical protein BC834DRAFT_55857 [Gloeopeniophorella convolvens]|nr:hypothetical protein BC834DRAFT_55857 [Gloeopeniophorella convolvens]